MIEGDPIPAARPRFNYACYQPASNREYRREVERSAQIAMCGRLPMSGPLAVVVKLYRKYSATSKKFGDVDNHLKGIFDGLNGIVFADDSQIVRCVVEKFTDKDKPRAEVYIESLTA